MGKFREYLVEWGKETHEHAEPHKMDTKALHHHYDNLRNTRNHTDVQKKRLKELEKERQRRGFKPRMTADEQHDMWNRPKPKPRIRYMGKDGKWKMGY